MLVCGHEHYVFIYLYEFSDKLLGDTCMLSKWYPTTLNSFTYFFVHRSCWYEDMGISNLPVPVHGQWAVNWWAIVLFATVAWFSTCSEFRPLYIAWLIGCELCDSNSISHGFIAPYFENIGDTSWLPPEGHFPTGVLCNQTVIIMFT